MYLGKFQNLEPGPRPCSLLPALLGGRPDRHAAAVLHVVSGPKLLTMKDSEYINSSKLVLDFRGMIQSSSWIQLARPRTVAAMGNKP
jgi:hypothetical protein